MIRSGVVVAVDSALPNTSFTGNARSGKPLPTKPGQQYASANHTSLNKLASTLTVRLDTLVGCGSCSAAGGCGIQLLPSANKPIQIDCSLPPNYRVSVGQTVQVSIPEPSQGWLMLVLRAYGWPTIGMLLGAIAGFWGATLLSVAQYQELFSVIGFVFGLSGGLLAWDRLNKSGDRARTTALHFELTGRLTGELLLPSEHAEKITGQLTGGQQLSQQISQTDSPAADTCSYILTQEKKHENNVT